MKIAIVRENLLRLLTRSAIVAKPKTPAPILTCCLLETEGDQLRATATDTFQAISSTVPCDAGSTAFGAAVSARDLLDRVKTLPEGLVTLERSTERLKISSGKRRHVLPCFPPDEFPVVNRKLEGGMTLPGKVLLDLFRRTRAMVGGDIGREFLKGVLLEFEAGKISATATDGHRLSHCTADVPGCKVLPKRLVPIEAVDALVELIDPEHDIVIGKVNLELGVEMPGLVMVTKLIGLDYPPYKQMMGGAPSNELVVSKRAFVDALASTEKATEGTAKGLITIIIGDGVVQLRGHGKGEADDEIDAQYRGPKVTLGVCARYMLDALATIDAENARINVGGELDPIWLRRPDAEDVLHVVMPIRQ